MSNPRKDRSREVISREAEVLLNHTTFYLNIPSILNLNLIPQTPRPQPPSTPGDFDKTHAIINQKRE
jgi:hypothetical protein